MIRVVTVVGARPQFIKASVLSRLFGQNNDFEEVLIHTGQHFDHAMSAQFFQQLQIPEPHLNLNINQSSHGVMTGQILMGIEPILQQDKPDLVLVYGDTNSTLAGALAASKLGIKIAHVESGMRSYNRHMPEESNRVLTDHLSDFLLCSTQGAVDNLAEEGIREGVVHVGDIMHDAMLFACSREGVFDWQAWGLNQPNAYGVLTIHRQESTSSDEALQSRLDFSQAYGEQYGLTLLFPVHPRLDDRVASMVEACPNILLLPPLGYFEIQQLLAGAKIVLTDSGGLQKESYFHQVPCITLRSETEWVETIAAGWNRLWTSEDWLPRQALDVYGHGDAGEKMLDFLRASITFSQSVGDRS